MKKRMVTLAFMCILCIVMLCSCQDNGDNSLTYQDYFDLGMRYLSEGNYQEAIIAFTAAIDIDPKQAPAYVGRGDAYVLSGETEENLAAAKADYEKAIELDETNEEAYLKLAEIYQKQGNEEAAKQILQQGSDTTSSEELQNRILELSKLKPKEGYPKTEQRDYGEQMYTIVEYDKYGQVIHQIIYNADGTIFEDLISEHDEWGNHVYEYVCQYDRSYTVERFFDQSERIIEEKGSYGDESWIMKYDYTNCPTAIISVKIRNSTIFVNKEEFNASITHQMQDAAHTVRANNHTGLGLLSTQEGDYYSISVEEYGPGKYGFRKKLQGTNYWEDGTIGGYETYDPYSRKIYDKNGELISSYP